MRCPECPNITPKILLILSSHVPICSIVAGRAGEGEDQSGRHLLLLFEAPFPLGVGLAELPIK